MSSWPLQVTPLTPASCGSALWRQGPNLWATVIVKVTLRMIHGGQARLHTPIDVVRDECCHGPAGSVAAASEAAPYISNAGVLLSGHAHAPQGRSIPAAAVRLGVGREHPLVDKAFHVVGRTGPFQQVPLIYERAYGGPAVDENPVGTGASPGTPEPNIIHLAAPHRPVGFGPIAKHWPVRRRLLGDIDPKALEQPLPEFPPSFDWRYYQAAPPDQQFDELRGGECIVLDGMHPALPRVQTRLPALVARAEWRLAGPGGAGPTRAVDLRADMLVIDADTLLCSVIWRGRIPTDRPSIADALRVSAAIEVAGEPAATTARVAAIPPVPVAAPSAVVAPAPVPPAPSPSAPRSPANEPLTGTTNVDLRRVVASVMPFGSPESAAAAAARKLAGAQLGGTVDVDPRSVRRPALPFIPTAPAGAPPAESPEDATKKR